MWTPTTLLGNARSMKTDDESGYDFDGTEYSEKETLEWLYQDEKLSTSQMGDVLGCDPMTVVYWMDKHDIERRSKGEGQRMFHRHDPVPIVHQDGYERWKCSMGENESERVFVHRLVAVAEFGFDAVCGHDVHHGRESHLPACEIPWANWGENLRLVNQSEHSSIHNKRTFGADEVAEIRSRYAEEGATYVGLADEYEVSSALIGKVLNRRGPYAE